MVVPFSNSKLRVPPGFQSLLVGLSTEVLRSQPRNIHAFAADYFEKLLRRREQGHSQVPDQQRSLEDRYYNNRTFQEDYSVNRPDLNDAATKIQAQYRGHRTRENLRQTKDDNKHMIDDEEQDDVEEKEESHHSLTRISHVDHDQKESPRKQNDVEIADVQNYHNRFEQEAFDDEPEPSSDQNRFNDSEMKESATSSPRQNEQDENEVEEGNWANFPPQQHSNDLMDSDRQEPIDLGEHDDVDNVDQSQRSNRSADYEDDMNDDNNRDKAATRIQASYRGYKIRKELGSTSGHSQSIHEHNPSSVSPRHDDDYDSARSKNILSPSAEGNKGPVNEHDDNAAAIKIQAAYRGYRVRKDLDK